MFSLLTGSVRLQEGFGDDSDLDSEFEIKEWLRHAQQRHEAEQLIDDQHQSTERDRDEENQVPRQRVQQRRYRGGQQPRNHRTHNPRQQRRGSHLLGHSNNV